MIFFAALVACNVAATPPTKHDVDGDGVAAGKDCDDENADVSETQRVYLDDDNDGYGGGAGVDACGGLGGYVENADDCDDARVDVYPGAAESCDGVDGDCDGVIDNDALDGHLLYADADGDGYGDVANVAIWCTPPADFVADDTDCDDTNADAHPGQVESCNDIDDDCDGTIDVDAVDQESLYVDDDGDGYGVEAVNACPGAGYADEGGDCDDVDPLVNPAANESCDDVDEDCDGAVDDLAADATDWYLDADEDGYGRASPVLRACAQPELYVDNAEDCDDGDDAISPDAVEICDDLDNDCDGATDPETAADALVWYADTDLDGYGDASVTQAACGQPAGHVPNDDDCADADAAISPVGVERCNTTDDDCDGTVDEADAVDAPTWYLDDDADGYGGDTTSVSCDAPPDHLAVTGDCDDAEALAAPDLAETCDDGIDNDCSGDDSGCDWSGTEGLATAAGGEIDSTGASAFFGGSISVIDDVDGDGLPDLAIGGAGQYSTLCAAYVVSGVQSGSVSLGAATIATFTGEASDDRAGPSAGGDMDGDGDVDLLIGAAYNDAAASNAGAVYFVEGPLASTGLSSVTAKRMGVAAEEYLGEAAVFDIDDDGLAEPAATAVFNDIGGAEAGAIYGWASPPVGVADASDADYILYSETAGDGLDLVTSAGDVNGDGVEDLMAGAPRASRTEHWQGFAWIVYGPVPAGTTALDTGADATITGAYDDLSLGQDGGALGDVDGDGLDDVWFQGTEDPSSGADSYEGWVATFAGADLSGTVSYTDAFFRTWGLEYLDVVFDAAGGDFNGDGEADLAVVSIWGNVGMTDNGGAYVFYGPYAGTLPVSDADANFGGAAEDDSVSAIAAADFNGDGFDDLAIGAKYGDAGAADAGVVYLLYGTGE